MAFCRAASACSYAFFSSSFLQVMDAWARSLSRYFWVSPRRFCSAILSPMSVRASSKVLTLVSVRDSSVRISIPSLRADHPVSVADLHAFDHRLQRPAPVHRS
jgi:hypothetical protein